MGGEGGGRNIVNIERGVCRCKHIFCVWLYVCACVCVCVCVFSVYVNVYGCVCVCVMRCGNPISVQFMLQPIAFGVSFLQSRISIDNLVL